MTLRFIQQHPNVLFLAAWIGLKDIVRENRFMWVNGVKSKSDVMFWRLREPKTMLWLDGTKTT